MKKLCLLLLVFSGLLATALALCDVSDDTSRTFVNVPTTLAVTCPVGNINATVPISTVFTIPFTPQDYLVVKDASFTGVIIVDGTNLVFSRFTGTTNITLHACYNATASYTYTRVISMACCGNSLVDVFEPCDATCCLRNCAGVATNATVYNNNTAIDPVVKSVAYSVRTITFTALNLFSTAAYLNYPPSYTLVSAVPDQYTYAPLFPPNFAVSGTTSLTWTDGWVGTYVLTFSMPYCGGDTFLFTRYLTLTQPVADSTCEYLKYVGSTAGCSPASFSLGDFNRPTRCDCSLRQCQNTLPQRTCGGANASALCLPFPPFPAGTCCTSGPSGALTCGRNRAYTLANVCQDVLMPKPRSVFLIHYFDTNFATSWFTKTIGCPAVCGDLKLDTNETCDTGGAYASCCTSTCNATAPSIGFPSVASINTGCATTLDLTTLQLTTTTNNFNYALEIDSVQTTGGINITTPLVTLNASGITLSAPYTGTMVITFKTLFCNATRSYLYYMRTITLNCCGNGIQNIGEECDLGANNGGLSGTCCSTQCTYISAVLSHVCRPSAFACDINEYCDGSSSACPVDSLQPVGTSCQDPTLCTDGGTCDSLGACNVPVYANGTVCRSSVGACDSPETCMLGVCPPDTYYDSSYMCRNSSGICDVEEFCTGTTTTCPVDAFVPSGTTCRNQTGICDIEETCTGVSPTCPVDDVQPNTYICKASDGVCEATTYCTGLDKTCSSPYFFPPDTLCRAKADQCDVAEYCDGSTALCPSDLIEASGTECRASAGICDPHEVCDGISIACPVDDFFDSSNICRNSTGNCDPTEYCTGSSVLCPNDVLLPNGYVCSASTGPCQLESVCSGTDGTCPDNIILSVSDVCRASTGPCDIQEYCDGENTTCPSNSYLPSDVVCSASLGECMPTTNCSGSSASCDVLPLYGSNHVCRAVDGDCDKADVCNGVSVQCGADLIQPRGHVCGPADGPCGVEAMCTGISKLCPVYNPDNIPCHVDNNLCFDDFWDTSNASNPVCVRGPAISYDDGIYCNGVETCDAITGLKIPGVPVVCPNTNSCFRTTCDNVLGLCVDTPQANTQGPCGGGEGVCSPGVWNCTGTGPFPSSVCVGEVLPSAEICGNGLDDNCDGQVDEFCSVPCSVDADCQTLLYSDCMNSTCSGSFCTTVYLPFDTPCDDHNSCTYNDKCNNYGLCKGSNAICDDFNECTNDSCEDGRCIFDGQYYEGVECSSTDLCASSAQCSNQGQCVVTSRLECGGTNVLCAENQCNATTGDCDLVQLFGVACDDGDACTYNDACTVNGCVGSPRICEDFNGCTDNTCIAPCGVCVNNVVNSHCYIDGQCIEDGVEKSGDPCLICNVSESAYQWSFTNNEFVVCDDGNPCTTTDFCNLASFSCAGTQQDCSYLSDDCLDGICRYGECTTVPKNIGGPCDDGLFCTHDDTCNPNGLCAGLAVDCSVYSTLCTISTCEEETLGCTLTPVVDYTRCALNDDMCDGEEYCLSGDCVTSGVLNCSALHEPNQCIEYVCDPQYGCIGMPLYLHDCDDGNVCTVGDFCGVDSICYPGWLSIPCDDGNPDTEDSCHADTGCQSVYVGDTSTCFVDADCPVKTCQEAVCANSVCRYVSSGVGTRCSDGNACNGEEYCVGNGVCISIFQLNCNDGNECTEDSCDPDTGCVFTPLDGNMCDDHNDCTLSDVCHAGLCYGTNVVCSENTDCMNYACASINGSPHCVGTPVHIDGSCTTDNLCEQGGTCSIYGICDTQPTACPQVTECIASYTCVDGDCIPEYSPPYLQCNLDNLCNVSFCDGIGHCIADANLTTICIAENDCQEPGVCIPTTGECATIFKDNGTPCDDHSLCTSDDACMYGDCVGQNELLCTSYSQCHEPSSCNPSTGLCPIVAFPDNYPCNDENVCTTVDVCIGGGCSGIADLQCTEKEGNVCYEASCDPIYGCLYTYVDDISCDDGDECTTNTTCNSGICGGGLPMTCFASTSCGTSYCVPEIGCLVDVETDCGACSTDSDCPYIACKTATCLSGTCTYDENNAALTFCDDGQYCNGDEQCFSGTCYLGRPPNCDDDNSCTDDTCNYNLNQCEHSAVPQGTSCSGSDLCALSSECDGIGHCLTTESITCDTSNPCRVNSGCDSASGVCSYVVLADGAACDNGDLCSEESVCVHGVCNKIESVDCHASDWCTRSSICLPETGDCFVDSVEDNWCNDENTCTLGDKCTASNVCQGGQYGYCDYIEVQDVQCQMAQCSDGGNCTIINFDDETPCSTGMPIGPCSGRDVCLSGACTRTYNPGFICREADLTGCDVPDACVDGNNYCPHDDKIADETSCDSEIFCYSTVCRAGQCVNDQPIDCSSFDTECTAGYCDEINRQCTYNNLANGLTCVGNEWGQCISYSSCYFGACVTYYQSVGSTCDDGNACTVGEHCSGYDGSCIDGQPLDCSSLDGQCSVGVCNSLNGLCQAQNANENSTCNADSNACTVDDRCHLGSCVPGAQMNCSYLDNSCQYGVCSGGSCTAVITGPACSPNYCTGNCTVPFVWWSIHNSHCPSTRRYTWPGGLETQTLCGRTFYSWSQVDYKSFAWRYLFQQWIAAKLNTVNGACLPVSTNSTMLAAYALLQQCDTSLLLSSPSALTYKSLAIALYSYNTGAFGPGLCNPSGCLYPPYGNTHCLFYAGLLSARDEFDEFLDDDGYCVNGVWDEGLLSCRCALGWTGTYCTECAVPDEGEYVCVPSFADPWAYTLRIVPTNHMDDYLNGYHQLVAMPERPAIIPGTEGLDCGCRLSNGGALDEFSARDLTVSATYDDFTVYITAINEDLDLCTQFFDIVVTNTDSTCEIDGVFCDTQQSNFSDICDCCREDDDDCACPHNDIACLRDHLKKSIDKADTYEDTTIYLAAALGVSLIIIFFSAINWLCRGGARGSNTTQYISSSRKERRRQEEEEEAPLPPVLMDYPPVLMDYPPIKEE